jgi:lipocalin
MDSLLKWLGPGAIVGGMGAAMLCGAGLAGADTGADAGPGSRAPHSASASGVAKTGADQPSRKNRTAPSGAASELAPNSRVVAASVTVRTNNNTPPAAPAAAIPAAQPAAAAAPASTPAPVAAAVVASSVPVDPAQFAGKYYEQGSVKQFFSIGLVNTKAVYTAKPDGTLGVKNSGNYFFNRGPKSKITGSAVPVNATNTALNVGFFGGTPSANPPGNYLILDRAPDYSWAIVSDPSGRSGYILTRSKTIDPQTYQQLLARARELGVTGSITPTRQFA